MQFIFKYFISHREDMTYSPYDKDNAEQWLHKSLRSNYYYYIGASALSYGIAIELLFSYFKSQDLFL